MKTNIALIISFALFSIQSNASPVVGFWKTIDDETGKPKSIVEIFKDGEKFKGKIVHLINPKKENPVCDKCDGDRKDQPVLGMEFMWGFEVAKAGKKWDDGEILDPNNGKIYSCKMTLEDDGKKLDVRGFIGFSLLGRTQTWHRSSPEELAEYKATKN